MPACAAAPRPCSPASARALSDNDVSQAGALRTRARLRARQRCRRRPAPDRQANPRAGQGGSSGGRRAAARLQARVAGAEADQLHALLHEPGHDRQHQVRALLEVQPADEADERRLRARLPPPVGRAQAPRGQSACSGPGPFGKRGLAGAAAFACCGRRVPNPLAPQRARPRLTPRRGGQAMAAVATQLATHQRVPCTRAGGGGGFAARRASGRSGSPSSACSAALHSALPRLKLLRP